MLLSPPGVRLSCLSLLSSLLLVACHLPLFVFSSLLSLCRHHLLARVDSSVQQLPVLLEYVCSPYINSGLSDSLTSFLCILFQFRILFSFSSPFSSYFVVLLVVWCSRTRYAGISRALPVNLRFCSSFRFSALTAVCDHI